MTRGESSPPLAWWSAAGLSLVALLLAFQRLVFPRVTDPDAFYHVGHAARYLEAGPFDSAFPWTAWSAIGEAGADLWYGLHLLLLPFAGVDDPAVAIRIAAVVLAVAGVACVARVARTERWIVGPIWPVLFLIAVPNVLYRYLSVRPEVVSVPLVVLLLHLAARGRTVGVAVVAGVLAWVHLSMWWLTAGVVVVACGVRWAIEGRAVRTELARTVAAATAGMFAGALLRPNPIGALELAWIQIAQLFVEKSSGVPLTFATELSPIGAGVLLQMAWPLLVVWLAAVVLVVRDRGAAVSDPASRVTLIASAVIAAGFLVLTLAVARRSLVYWTAFAIPGVALVATHHLAAHRAVVSRVLLFSLIPLAAWSVRRNDLNARFIAIQPDRLEAAATFLADASEPGDLVFNTHWDAFGPLFARNRVNRYLGGMDPIFQYTADARRYWLFHHLSTGVATAVTCPAPTCAAGETIDTWQAVRGEFGARWILAEPARDGALIAWLDADPRFRRAFEGRDGVVFEVAVRVSASGAPGSDLPARPTPPGDRPG